MVHSSRYGLFKVWSVLGMVILGLVVLGMVHSRWSILGMVGSRNGRSRIGCSRIGRSRIATSTYVWCGNKDFFLTQNNTHLLRID
jgi:hypothetical protein